MYAVSFKALFSLFWWDLPQSMYASILAAIVIDFLVLIGSLDGYWRWCNYWRIVEGGCSYITARGPRWRWAEVVGLMSDQEFRFPVQHSWMEMEFMYCTIKMNRIFTKLPLYVTIAIDFCLSCILFFLSRKSN